MIFLPRTISPPMNIIELFDKLELQREAIATYSANDVIRVEKQLNVERKLNPEIDANTASNLLHALRDHAPAFQFVLSKRHLYNFFTGKDLPKRHFPHDPPSAKEEDVRNFIGRFLADDLELKLDKALAANRFGSVAELLIAAEYLPEESLHRLEKRMTGKLEFGIGQMPREGQINTTGIDYMRLLSFYEVLSHFSSIEMDDKIRIVINRTSDMYNTHRERQFASDIMTCLPCYKAFDDDLNRVTQGNRDLVSSRGAFSGSGSGSGSGISGRVVFVVILLVLKLIVFGSRCSNDNSYQPYDENFGVQTGYLYETRRNDVSAAEFFDYLALYDKDSVGIVSAVDTIKTGQNPFDHLFTQKLANVNNLPGENATFFNRTPYDVVVFEFADSDAFNMASDAYFIKSGEKLNVKISNTGTIKQEYSFYFGNDLSTFRAGSNVIQRRDSLNEYRFRKPAPYCRDILNKKFRFENDVTITKDGGQLRLTSRGLKGVTDSLTDQGEYVF